jgi:NAD(P)-dependent dehydrogenase (short-subunit alcohol dehydrogenase family)
VLLEHNPKKIFIAARSADKALKTIEELREKKPDAPLEFLQCDLASLDSVQECARQFLSKSDRLDILLCNAGVMALPAGQTKEGYEMQFGTNHVGHALLLKHLLPLMDRTGQEPGADVRLVILSSMGHAMPVKGGIQFENVKSDMQSTSTWARYGQSKLANVLYAKAIAKRYPNIMTVSIHPGVVQTELATPFMGQYKIVSLLYNALVGTFAVNVQTGALNQLWAATAPREEMKTGEYYCPVGLEGSGSAWTKSEELEEKLWEWTQKELEPYKL